MNATLKDLLDLEKAGSVLTDCEPGRANALFQIIDVSDPEQVKLLELVRVAEEARSKLIAFVNALEFKTNTPANKVEKTEDQLLNETYQWLKENGSLVKPDHPLTGGIWSADRWVHPTGFAAMLADGGYTRIVSGGGRTAYQTADRPVEYSGGGNKDWLDAINYMLTNHAYPKNL